MSAKPMPSQSVLRKWFSYDPETGHLFWRMSPNRRVYIGRQAGTLNDSGHLCLRFRGMEYRGHRIIWKLVTGEDPPDHVDHINNNPADNRWSNLRLATDQQNQWNRQGTGSLPKGVQYRKGKRNPFSAVIVLGSFRTAEEASAAYERAARQLHGEFFALDRNADRMGLSALPLVRPGACRQGGDYPQVGRGASRRGRRLAPAPGAAA